MSTSLGGDQAESAKRFTSILNARASEGAPGTREIRQNTIDDVSSRIRDGRTDAAEVESDVRDAVRERDPVEDAADPDAQERSEERREPREERESRRERQPRQEQDGRQQGEDRDGDGLSSSERTIGLTDAGDARGHQGDDGDDGAGDGSDVIGSIPTVIQVPQAQVPRGAVGAPAALAGVAAIAPLAGAGANAGRGAAAPQVAPVAAVGRAGQTRGAARTQAASGPPPGAAQMERAEAILDQLKIHVNAGEREARLQLRPQELGMLDLHIKVEGGVVAANFAAESAETLAVLEAHAPELRAWLSKEGVERVELSFERMDMGADAGASGGQTRQSGGGREGNGRGQLAGSSAASMVAPSALTRALAHSSSSDTGVDFVA